MTKDKYDDNHNKGKEQQRAVLNLDMNRKKDK